jgi:hypothetical protein
VALLDRFAGLDRRLGLDRESEQRGSKKTVVLFLAMFGVVGLVPIGAALWNGHHDRDVASRLRRDGAVAAGEVVDVSRKGKLKAVAGQGAKVIFRTESGEEVSTWVTVRDVPPKGPTEVRYLRSDPSVARLVDDPAPRNGVWPVVSAVLFAAAWIGLVVASAMNFHRRKP